MRSFTQVGRLVVALAIGITACGRGAGSVESQVEESEGKAQPNKVEVKAPAALSPSKAERVSLVGAKIKGDEKAPVTIVEFSDYACPYCNKAHATVEALVKEYQGRVRLAVFENPLPFHTTAAPAAKWAFAAGEQGKFWEARDLLFANQKKLDDAGLVALAGTLGLDMERLEKDRAGQSAADYVEAGLKMGKTLGVKGTPTFFINGVRLTGAQPAESFRVTIEEELRRAEAMVATGVRPENVYAKLMEKASVAVDAEPGAGACESGDCDCADSAKHEVPDNEVYTIDVGQSPSRGRPNADVTIVAFTDTECPFCAQGEERIRTLEKEYGSKIRVVYKNMPMPFHKNAHLAAKAMMAAHKQGKFFEYKDVLFAHQDAQDRTNLLTYAQDLKLDMNRFSRDLEDTSLDAVVQADVAEARRVSAVGTPTFFVNGRRLIGAQPIQAFRKLVDMALAH